MGILFIQGRHEIFALRDVDSPTAGEPLGPVISASRKAKWQIAGANRGDWCRRIAFVFFYIAFCSNQGAHAESDFTRDLLNRVTPRIREALSHLQERPALYAMGMTEADLGSNTAEVSTNNQDVLYGQGLALAHEDRLEVSPYLVVRALKEATWKSYPRVDAALEKWVELAHRVLTARTSDDFANLRNVDQKRMEVGKAFHEAITAVAITDHRDEPLDRTTLLGEFIAAMEGEIIGVEKARAEQGLAALKPMPQQVIHATNPIQPTNPAVVRPLEPSATAKEIYQKKPLSKESDALSGTDFPTDKLVPWRKIRVLNDPNTQLLVEGENGKVYRIPGGVRVHFLNLEKGGPAVNICRALENGANLFIRCDRKGGFRDGPRPRPWWWRYEAVIEGSTLRIISVGQKDGPLERGERVSDHFHEDIEETDGR